MTDWATWFAWHPVQTLGGRWVWLKTVERRWEWEMNFHVIDPYDPGDYDGGWQYRLPLSRKIPAEPS